MTPIHKRAQVHAAPVTAMLDAELKRIWRECGDPALFLVVANAVLAHAAGMVGGHLARMHGSSDTGPEAVARYSGAALEGMRQALLARVKEEAPFRAAITATNIVGTEHFDIEDAQKASGVAAAHCDCCGEVNVIFFDEQKEPFAVAAMDVAQAARFAEMILEEVRTVAQGSLAGMRTEGRA
ncbi:MAG TPA: hypothetical protein VM434_12230 [Beijerinckiaceae bacterium]|nr:hypothetical protein [Beijerinckiaceae bacterium]